MNLSSALRRQLVFWGFTLALWGLVVLAFAGQLMVARSLEATQALKVALGDWLPWLVLAPAIAWLAVRFPLELRKLPLSVPVHLAACALAALLFEVISRQTGLPPSPPPEDARPRFPGPGGGGGRPAFGPGRGPGQGQGDDFGPDGPPRAGDFRSSDRPFGREPQGGPGFAPGTNAAFDPGGRGRPPEDFRPNRPRGPDDPDFQRGPQGFPRNRQPMPPGNAEDRGLVHTAVLKSRSNIPIYWVVVSIVHALTYYRRSQERERKALELEARLADAKLQALRMQLHPHFLFNTLNAISTLVHRDPRAADEMIGNLSELLRATLDTSEAKIPLRQELGFLDRYLEIQQVRFGERLRIEKEIDAAALEAQVPTLILQPLVENAVRHGIEPQTEPGLVRIVARREGDLLRLTIQNSGLPAKPGPKTREGIGLPNTQARLREMYGDLGRMTLTSGSEGGFTVDLEIPYHESKA
jgi:signal transduction histidine kinase